MSYVLFFFYKNTHETCIFGKKAVPLQANYER